MKYKEETRYEKTNMGRPAVRVSAGGTAAHHRVGGWFRGNDLSKGIIKYVVSSVAFLRGGPFYEKERKKL